MAHENLFSSTISNCAMKQVQSFRGIPHYRIDVIRSYYMDEEHLNKAKGGATKRAPSTIYNIPSTYTGEKFGLLTYVSYVKGNYGKYQLN